MPRYHLVRVPQAGKCSQPTNTARVINKWLQQAEGVYRALPSVLRRVIQSTPHRPFGSGHVPATRWQSLSSTVETRMSNVFHAIV